MKDSCSLRQRSVRPGSGIGTVQSNLLVDVQLAEDLGRIQEVLVLVDPAERTVVLVGLQHGGAGKDSITS